ncbi:MAG: response regulator transcription factor [Thiomargarita sp.]|nr:response regulator transcription factor [Thiomargarita sp.]
MKILIVDDEPLARMRLQSLIEELGLGEVVAEAANGKEALENIRIYEPDIVLLDIRMPGMDGIEVSHQLKRLDSAPAIIFTTAYSDHAVEAFEQQAVDYLLKPIRKERLEQALKRTNITASPQSPQARTHISYYQGNELHLIAVKQIYYFEAFEKYVRVISQQGEALISDTLKSLEQEFSGQFLRIHRSTLVAVVDIEGLKKDFANKRSYLQLNHVDKSLEISKRHLSSVKKLLSDMRLISG